MKAKEAELEGKEHSRSRMDEDQENHREDVRKLVEMMQKEEVEKEEAAGR